MMTYKKEGESISNRFSAIYTQVGIDTAFKAIEVILTKNLTLDFPEIKPELLAQKSIMYEETKTDFFGFIKKTIRWK